MAEGSADVEDASYALIQAGSSSTFARGVASRCLNAPPPSCDCCSRGVTETVNPAWPGDARAVRTTSAFPDELSGCLFWKM